MRKATLRGIDLSYQMEGDTGDPLVLVHGFTGDVSDWHHQVGYFSRSYRVLAMDLRGHGQSDAPDDRSSYAITDMAADVEQLISHLALGRYHLVGHSMGGGIAQELALRRPKSLLSLTLEDTTYRFGLASDGDAMAWWEQRRDLAERQGMAAVAGLEPQSPPPPHMPAERLQAEIERLAKMSAHGFLGSMDGLFGWEGTEARAQHINAPTLIIVGELDGPGLIEGSVKLAELIPGATIEVIPEAGHSPQWERPELFNAILGKFLTAH